MSAENEFSLFPSWEAPKPEWLTPKKKAKKRKARRALTEEQRVFKARYDLVMAWRMFCLDTRMYGWTTDVVRRSYQSVMGCAGAVACQTSTDYGMIEDFVDIEGGRRRTGQDFLMEEFGLTCRQYTMMVEVADRKARATYDGSLWINSGVSEEIPL